VLGLRVGGGIYRTVFTPDRKAGGYWVSVPELPGCVTEGDTVEDAKRMARDAIALWLDVGVRLPTAAQQRRGRAARRVGGQNLRANSSP
jgi:predicted RNase H-like HicB family nuclease